MQDITIIRLKKCDLLHIFVRKNVNYSKMLTRNALNTLRNWKEQQERKPLLIRGARQVGKTWLMKEFGRLHFENTAYVNFESSGSLKNIFKENYDIERILLAIQIETGIRIESENTLLILDEIQEAEGGITALKYFYEYKPELHLIAAGSLLGVAIHSDSSFPVGKVNFLDLHPLDFREFLLSQGEQSLQEIIDDKRWNLINSFKEKLKHYLRLYYFIGGMPEVLNSFVEYKDFKKVRKIQNEILTAYEYDFSKHAPDELVPRLRQLWNSIPSQLARENKKFIYNVIKSGARAKDYELALAWLKDSGLVNKVSRVSKPGFPLKSYEDLNAFKLFISDVGLLGAMTAIDEQTMIKGNKIFTEFKGALTEQYVFQQINAIEDISVFYWSAERATAEVDFLIQYSEKIIPIEVKAEENLRSKSLKTFYNKFEIGTSIRTSMSDYRKESWMINVPLYCLSSLKSIIS